MLLKLSGIAALYKSNTFTFTSLRHFVSCNYVGILSICQYLYLLIYYLTFNSLLFPCCRPNVLQSVGPCFFTAEMGHVIQSDMLTLYHSPTDLFSPVHLSFSSLHELEWLSHLQQSPAPVQFPLPDVVIATDTTPTHWAFYFQGSDLPLSVSGP